VSDGPFRLLVEGGYGVEARAVIAAPGMVWRRLAVEGIEDLLGRGVYYGAGRSEAAQCGGEQVVVVGAGNSAGQAVMHLANAGARVTMLVRGDRLGKSMSAYLVERIAAHPLVEVRLRTEVAGVDEDGGHLSGATVRDGAGATGQLPARSLFLCLGGEPRTGWAAQSGVATDRAGYTLTGPDLLDRGRRPPGWPLARDPLALETSLPGVFVAGDARHGSTKRVAGAVGEGAMATALVHRRLDELPGSSPAGRRQGDGGPGRGARATHRRPLRAATRRVHGRPRRAGPPAAPRGRRRCRRRGQAAAQAERRRLGAEPGAAHRPAERELVAAGRSASGAVQEKLRATLHAVAGDPGAREALAAGRLVRDHEASGLGPLAEGAASPKGTGAVRRERESSAKADAALERRTRRLEERLGRARAHQRDLEEQRADAGRRSSEARREAARAAAALERAETAEERTRASAAEAAEAVAGLERELGQMVRHSTTK